LGRREALLSTGFPLFSGGKEALFSAGFPLIHREARRLFASLLPLFVGEMRALCASWFITLRYTRVVYPGVTTSHIYPGGIYPGDTSYHTRVVYTQV